MWFVLTGFRTNHMVSVLLQDRNMDGIDKILFLIGQSLTGLKLRDNTVYLIYHSGLEAFHIHTFR